MNVQVNVIRCAKCDVPYVLRWAFFVIDRPDEYVYQPDCKCKAREFVAKVETALLSGVGAEGETP